MPPLELGTAAGIAKYAPILFLTVNGKGVSLNVAQLVHTLLVAGIVAAVTMYGTQQAINVELLQMRRDLVRLNAIAEEAIKVQREIVPMRNLQVQTLQNETKELFTRVIALERVNANRR